MTVNLDEWCREHPEEAACLADEPARCCECPAFVAATYDCRRLPVGLGFCAASRDWPSTHASQDACDAFCDALFDEVCRQKADATLDRDELAFEAGREASWLLS